MLHDGLEELVLIFTFKRSLRRRREHNGSVAARLSPPQSNATAGTLLLACTRVQARAVPFLSGSSLPELQPGDSVSGVDRLVHSSLA